MAGTNLPLTKVTSMGVIPNVQGLEENLSDSNNGKNHCPFTPYAIGSPTIRSPKTAAADAGERGIRGAGP